MIISLNLKFHYIFILISGMVSEYQCYEKTLRKIVRNQSKMVQRPISDNNDYNIWSNTTKISQESLPAYTQVKSVIHKMQRPKISTILSSVDTGRSRTMYSKINKNENLNPYELRMARDAVTNALQSSVDINVFSYGAQDSLNFGKVNNKSDMTKALKTIPISRFFSPLHDSKENDTSPDDNSILVQENISLELDSNINKSSLSSADTISIANFHNVVDPQLISITAPEYNVEKGNFLVKEVGMVTEGFEIHNISKFSYICLNINEVTADIDAQTKFSEFNIEPKWMGKKQFWNKVYDSRYESLMRNSKWPSLKVILIPKSNVHSIWKRPFENLHNDTVHKIISNIVKKLQFYPNLTFSWNEVSHLAQWWKSARQKSRMAIRRLVNEGRLEITTGGWVETDESTSHLFGIIHQLIEGHQWLQHHLNYSPKIAWLTESVTHSPTLPYLLAASEISHLVISNLHYSWQQYLSEYQYTDFIWVQNWDDQYKETNLNEALQKIGNDRYPRSALLTHYLQFNTAGFRACGPLGNICATEYNFVNINNNVDINTFNVKEKSENLLEEYSKTGTTSSHNVVIAPIGDSFTYEFQTEFDYQYNNYQKIAEFVNINQDIYKATIDFGTTKDYFDTVLSRHKSFPTLKGDFLNFADIKDGSPAYWTGLFTTRPIFKILLRRLQSTLRTTEILLSFALNYNVFKTYNISKIFVQLLNAREIVARLQDKNVVSGTVTEKTLKYVHTLILKTAKDCWSIQEIAASLLSSKPEQNDTYLEKYVYREGEFISSFKSVIPGDQIFIFNSLSHERSELVEVMSRKSNIRIIDYNEKDIMVQVNPIWKYSPQNKIAVSKQLFKIIFHVVIPPMAFKLFKVKETRVATHSAATIYCIKCEVEDIDDRTEFPFNIKPLETGDIQLENYEYRLIFDEYTGFLKSITKKSTNVYKMVDVDFGAFRSSHINSGMFLFNTNTSKPLEDILLPFKVDQTLKTTMIISGKITTDLVTVYGELIQHIVKIFNLIESPFSQAIKFETKVDYEAVSRKRELEIFLSIQTDISNGDPPELYIDNNGFQYTRRTVNLNRRMESNVYPMTNIVFIEDDKSRLSIVTDHAQGVTCLQEGQVVIMLDRRVLRDDNRGSDEGVSDSSMSYHTHYLLVENFLEAKIKDAKAPPKTKLILPSLTALYLANTLNYHLDLYFIDIAKSNHCIYGFLPLVKAWLPCDVAVINYRVVLNRGTPKKYTPNTALMTLHRQSFSCSVEKDKSLQCAGGEIKLNKVFRNIKAVYQTNLVGTSEGVAVNVLNNINFPPMEIITLRIYY